MCSLSPVCQRSCTPFASRASPSSVCATGRSTRTRPSSIPPSASPSSHLRAVQTPPFILLTIALLNDGVIMTLSVDPVVPSTTHDLWGFAEDLGCALTDVACLCIRPTLDTILTDVILATHIIHARSYGSLRDQLPRQQLGVQPATALGDPNNHNDPQPLPSRWPFSRIASSLRLMPPTAQSSAFD